MAFVWTGFVVVAVPDFKAAFLLTRSVKGDTLAVFMGSAYGVVVLLR